MLSLVLRTLNAPGLILMTTIGIAIQTSLFAWWPLNYLQPDVVLLVVIWCAFRRRFVEGGILTLIVADLAEIHSGSSAGLLLIAYMAVYLGVRASSRLLVIPDLSSYVLVTLFASVGWRLSALGVLELLGSAQNQWRQTLLHLFPGAVIEGLLALVRLSVARALRRRHVQEAPHRASLAGRSGSDRRARSRHDGPARLRHRPAGRGAGD